jgi:hypothetical protein
MTGAGRTRKPDLSVRRLVAGQCQACGRQFFYRRTGRPRNFCDQRCRQADFRRSGYLWSKIDESVQKNEVKSKAYRADFGDRPSFDPGLWRLILEIEIFAGLAWQAVISLDGVHCQVARFAKPLDAAARIKAVELIAQIPADLSIPDFLRRRPAPPEGARPE